MSVLLELCRTNKYDTDKFVTDNTVTTWISVKHSYVEAAYGKLFEKNLDIKNVLEIGIWKGGSHLLWRDYFPNATVTGIDVGHCNELTNQERIIQVITDAYTDQAVNLFDDGSFDIIIDDGPHTLHTMKYVVEKYLPKLSKNGILCIEDISEYSWLYELSNLVPIELRDCIKVYDLRKEDNKDDSILMVIDKGELNGKS